MIKHNGQDTLQSTVTDSMAPSLQESPGRKRYLIECVCARVRARVRLICTRVSYVASTSVYTHLWRLEVTSIVFPDHRPPCFWVPSSLLAISASQRWRHRHAHHHGFHAHLHAGDLNSGPHAYTASTCHLPNPTDC